MKKFARDRNRSFSADEVGFEILIRLVEFDLEAWGSYTNFKLEDAKDYIDIQLFQ